MMGNPLISVIIPAYNVELYIRKCLDSVINQSYKNIEILLVDDGSTDNTSAICDEYASRDSRILVIHKNNEGQAVARNVGLDKCKGVWIHFLDSDDWIENDMYEILLSLAEKTGSDIVSCKYQCCTLERQPKYINDSNEVATYDTEEIFMDFFYNHFINFELWNKLFKRHLFDNLRFIRGQLSEEVHIDRIVYLKTNHLSHIEKTMYNYLSVRDGNTASSFKRERVCIFPELKSLAGDLLDRDMSQVVPYIYATGTKFTKHLFVSATKFNADKFIKREIRHWFFYFFKHIRFKSVAVFSDYVFFLSPHSYLYMLFLKLKYVRYNAK